jgi:allograft inflammatory factor 1
MTDTLTLDSPIEDFRKRYPYLTKKEIEACKHNFKQFDLNNDGLLELFEVKQMFEKMGQPKTHLECKQIIAEVDTTGKGAITFNDFMRVRFIEEQEEEEEGTSTSLSFLI